MSVAFIQYIALRSALPLLALLWAVAPARTAGMAAPSRIVALGGAVTEILYELGVAERIVGLDTTSVHPPDALTSKPNVGYLRQLSAEGILSLSPDLVLAVEGAGPPDVLKLVEGAGVPIAFVQDVPSPEGVRRKIETIATIVRKIPEGEALAARVASRFAALQEARKRLVAPVRVLFVLSYQNGRVMVGGRDTTAAGALDLAGATNVAASVQGYKPMSDEAIVASAPDVVVTISHGPGGPVSRDMLKTKAFAQTPAGKNDRLIVVDGPALLGFGPREADAARDLMARLYPNQAVE